MLTPAGIRALAMIVLHKLVPDIPGFWDLYRTVRDTAGRYDYQTMLSDVRHVLNDHRWRGRQQEYNPEKYIPKYMLIETDRVYRGNYKTTYLANWLDFGTGEESVSFYSIYSSAQCTTSDVLRFLQAQSFAKGYTTGRMLVGLKRVSVWHARGNPYAEGEILEEL